MSVSFEIRDATLDDLDAISRIYCHYVRETTVSFEENPPDVATMRLRFEGLKKAGYPYLVLCDQDGVQGYAYVGTYRARSAFRYTVEHSIYMNPETTRKGHGGALLAALIDACESKGYRQMIAIIGDSANMRSRQFHEKYGFHEVGITKNVGFKFGRWLDTVIMQRAIGEGR